MMSETSGGAGGSAHECDSDGSDTDTDAGADDDGEEQPQLERVEELAMQLRIYFLIVVGGS